jgi:DNA-binding response OmpR family regulator
MKHNTAELPVLIAQTGKLSGARWILDREQVLIGRGAECDVVVPDRQVSRHHARVRRTPSGYLLEDLASKNGTHLNGKAIDRPVVLQDGDVIQIALVLGLVFVGTEATIPLGREEVGRSRVAGLQLDPAAHRVWVSGQEIEPPLSPPQYRLLELLAQNPGRVVSREEVVEFVWPGSEGEGVSDQAIDALVRRLRQRLRDVDARQAYLLTVRGHGFRLENAS